MSEFLLELMSEEIPARMQTGAARDLERMAREGLAAETLAFDEVRAFAGARRLTLLIKGLPSRQDDRTEERRGPRVGAPAQAVEGFLRSTGLAADELEERNGVLFAVISRPGQPTPTILKDLAEGIAARFPWPKSMTTGSGAFRWVRPLRRVLALFDGEIVPIEIDGLAAGNLTEGHRVMGPRGPVRVRDFGAYEEALDKRFVVLSADERRRRIVEGARTVTAAAGLHWVEDFGLLEEVGGMVEWPVAILGDMEAAFLRLPPEVVRTTMRVHQRYFAVRKGPAPDAPLSPHFICIANVEAPDGGRLIAAGNARVLSARLNDARFFWDEDLKVPLADRLPRLAGVTFHARLGTLLDRVNRIEGATHVIAPLVGADLRTACEAARLAKADLASGMVGEFPELQGVMGGYYAEHEGLPAQVAAAIREHYRPQGPSDAIPLAPVSIAVALADKLDSLVGFFSIGEAPTGSRDPFALRRAALGVIRIILENGLRFSLGDLLDELCARTGLRPGGLMAFFAERLKVTLREAGRRHDLVDAVFALGDDDLVRVVARVEALSGFLASEDGANLLAAFRRAGNILAAEAKKGELPSGSPSRVAAPAEEAALYDALQAIAPAIETALAAEDFAAAMMAMAGLRAAVDAFFDAVLVNSEVPAERANRLRLLAQVRDAMLRVADFSKVAG
ncbi:MAG TPA: glycine--tRNA ligase subunit beta [Caulobacteraceae bacterium]|nr:glycine--tRNA ligase subunit beta [Caulobacteraceae bacterium]